MIWKKQWQKDLLKSGLIKVQVQVFANKSNAERLVDEKIRKAVIFIVSEKKIYKMNVKESIVIEKQLDLYCYKRYVLSFAKIL